MKHLDDNNRISLWLVPDDYFICSYGRITYAEWYRLESKRLSGGGYNVRMIHNKAGRIALFRNGAANQPGKNKKGQGSPPKA